MTHSSRGRDKQRIDAQQRVDHYRGRKTLYTYWKKAASSKYQRAHQGLREQMRAMQWNKTA